MPASELVVVANRLPVDRVTEKDGTESWRRSPGGLVTALEQVMAGADASWVGWGGRADLEMDPFEFDGNTLVPVRLSRDELEGYYEGFSNGTIWPLYHDVIAAPIYRRRWWDAYVRVNRRFAEAAAEAAAPGAFVWVQDYQLQLVPKLLRELRDDLTIGYVHHIPFPAYGLFAQLPWRSEVAEGLLGADVLGFQRTADASNFQRIVRRLFKYPTKSNRIEVPDADGGTRSVLAAPFPISIDAQTFIDLAKRPEILARAKEIREQLGNPRKILLGVDRLDYTKGIRHRLKAFGEMLQDGRVRVGDVTLVQVASPSRPGVEAYQDLRDEIELTVGRVNGDFDTMHHTAIRYLHQNFPREEMVALYLAADVMLITALRDGMNLVAKEYVAARTDRRGVLVLSEFAGAADELSAALMVNPHDIEGTKDRILQAIEMPEEEQTKRMRSMRRRVLEHDVERWGQSFLDAVEEVRAERRTQKPAKRSTRSTSTKGTR